MDSGFAAFLPSPKGNRRLERFFVFWFLVHQRRRTSSLSDKATVVATASLSPERVRQDRGVVGQPLELQEEAKGVSM